MPEFMMFIIDNEEERDALPASEFADAYAKVGAWWDKHEKAGHFVPEAGRRLQRASESRTVAVGDGAASVTDGPFVETKEAIGGFGILIADDMDEAVAIAKTWPGLPVKLEIRPVRTAGDVS
jgi:hypothetical protein